MRTLKDLILSYETEFAEKLHLAYTLLEKKEDAKFPIAGYSVQSAHNLASCLINMIEQEIDLMGEHQLPQIIMGSRQFKDRKKAKELNMEKAQAKMRFYRHIYNKVDEGINWQTLIHDVFGNKQHYLSGTQRDVLSMANAGKQLIFEKPKPLRSKLQREVANAVKAYGIARNQIAAAAFPSHSEVIDNYVLTAILYERESKTYTELNKYSLNASLKDVSKETIFGTTPPQNSIFYPTQITDPSVAHQHGKIAIIDGHLAYTHLSELHSSSIEDHLKNKAEIKIKQSVKLVPGNYGGGEIHPKIYFGRGAKYCLLIQVKKPS